MRLLAAAVFIATLIGTSSLAHADEITVIVSIVASGTVDNQAFTDKRITLIDTTSTEQYYEDGDLQGPGWSDAFQDSSTITIDGFGTYNGNSFEVSSGTYGDLQIGDPYGRLFIVSGLNAPTTPETIGPVIGSGYINDACDPFQPDLAPCPGYIETGAGNLYIDSVDSNSAVGEEIVTPEPSSLTLLGTGMIGLFGLARRKFSQVVEK